MANSTAQLLLPITGALFGLALLLMLIALRLFRRSRTHAFWRQRRQAGQRGWQVSVLSFLLFVASAVSCGITGFSFLLADDETPTVPGTFLAAQPSPTASLTEEVTPSSDADKTATGLALQAVPATATQSVPTLPPNTVVVVVTTTPVSTPTATILPTFTPIVPPIVSTVTALPDAALRITALDDSISSDLKPLNPRQEFAAGTTRLYLFVEYRSMTTGAVWRRELWRENTLIEENTYLWGLESTGSSYFFFGDDNGFSPGRYEIRLYIGSSTEPSSAMTFTIID